MLIKLVLWWNETANPWFFFFMCIDPNKRTKWGKTLLSMPYLATLCSKKHGKSVMSGGMSFTLLSVELGSGCRSQVWEENQWSWSKEEWKEHPGISQVGLHERAFTVWRVELSGCWRRKKMIAWESETIIWDEDRGWIASMVMLLVATVIWLGACDRKKILFPNPMSIYIVICQVILSVCENITKFQLGVKQVRKDPNFNLALISAISKRPPNS